MPFTKISTKLEAASTTKTPFVSFEFFPPATSGGQTNLYTRVDHLARLEPIFVDVTWGGGMESMSKSMKLAEHALKFSCLTTMLHLPCRRITCRDLRRVLNKCKEMGLRNVFALRGDAPPSTGHTPERPERHSVASEMGSPLSLVPPREDDDVLLDSALALVRFIRREFGDFFCIGVTGYPDKHPEAPSLEADIEALAEKVAAGADFVITQVLYSPDSYGAFVNSARRAGIMVPIIPGIMPVYDPRTFAKVVSWSGAAVPPVLADAVEAEAKAAESRPAAAVEECRAPVSDSFRTWTVKFVSKVCRELLDMGAPGLHFFTLNAAARVRAILAELDLESSACRRALPWRQSQAGEGVRPIHWANRPKSYITRTMSTPASESPTPTSASDKYLPLSEVQVQAPVESVDERRSMWGDSPITPQDINNVFAGYIQGKVSRLPWCEAGLLDETSTISEEIVELNRRGFLTINSQPRVNGCKSADPVFGWGGPGGYVYQKAYVECFASPLLLASLMEVAADFPSITYNAVDSHGNTYTNSRNQGVQAVTWGVFPGREVLQPTVVDPESFLVWKEESFSLWLKQWACIYDEDSPSYELVHTIHDTYFLIAVVDNDFVSGDVFAVFQAALKRMGPLSSP